MDYLEGGRENKIARSGNTVHRPSGFWTPSVHALLAHIRQAGFLNAPEPLGFDANGNGIVSFMAGEVSNYPLSENAASEEALVSAAQLLRAYHDATADFATQDHTWLLPPRQPAEVVCHGDFAPYNVVLRGKTAVSIIDFDTAHPAPRVWDIAYAIYRWAPFHNPNNPDGFGNLETQISRAKLFCDSYGVSAKSRTNLVEVMIERLQTLIAFMHDEAEKGNEAFQANLADGHHVAYLADIGYLERELPFIQAGL